LKERNMKSRTLLALAVAGACAWSTGALAGGTHHSARFDSSMHMSSAMSTEVRTPSSVDESAPWLAGEPHLAGWTSPQSSIAASETSHDIYGDASFGTGASSGVSGSGSVGSEPMASAETTDTEYWLIGAEPSERGLGSSASESGSGSVAFDSSMSEPGNYGFDSLSSSDDTVMYTSSAESIVDAVGEETSLVSEHYLVSGPLSSFDESDAIVLVIAPTEQDIALLESLKEDFFIVTPSYDVG
jgi:hypothetical protein